MSITGITEHEARTGSHTSFYLAAGPQDGPLIVFVHGWPELSVSWRHQIPAFAALGFRCVAPDMRGYGRSSIYDRKEDYAIEESVGDMLGLLDHLGRDRAIWVGHDWGAVVVWNIASHHPERCTAIANLCVPYSGPVTSNMDYIDRDIYPQDEYPAGQWEYMLYYYEHFDKAVAEFDANVRTAIKMLFRKGDPAGVGQPAMTAHVRNMGGFFGTPEEPGGTLPLLELAEQLPLDEDVLSEEDLQLYTEALERNGFFGPSSWYVNIEPNAVYAANALNDGVLEMPVLFIGGMYDFTCETVYSRAKEPMEKLCRDLTLDVIKSGHWMAQEKPVEVNGVLARWLATAVADNWPRPA